MEEKCVRYMVCELVTNSGKDGKSGEKIFRWEP